MHHQRERRIINQYVKEETIFAYPSSKGTQFRAIEERKYKRYTPSNIRIPV